MIKGIALYSGGLDSILAIKLILEQDCQVECLTFKTPFFAVRNCKSSVLFDKYPKVNIITQDITEDFLKVLVSPKHGYGKNLNPCIDCKILMLSQAKTFMEKAGADFVFTGEVLGQRPMSQRKDTLRLIERESGLERRLLRPLSARLLPPTLIEEAGLIDREKLLDISGRSRKRQIEMAKSMNLETYPTPGGGCILTDSSFARKLRSLFQKDLFNSEIVKWLGVGRTFQFGQGIVVVVGRNHKENEQILKMAGDDRILLKTNTVPGPIGVILGEASHEIIKSVASLIASYSDANAGCEVEISLARGKDFKENITVVSMPKKDMERYKI